MALATMDKIAHMDSRSVVTANPVLVTTREAAQRLGISRTSLLRAVRSGDILPAMRTAAGALRFHVADLNRFTALAVSSSLQSENRPAPVDGHSPRTAVTNQALAVYTFDTDGAITMCHGAGLAALGYAPEAMIGRTVFELFEDEPRALDHPRSRHVARA
jgi:excisionase family DNA binding protein